MPEYITIAEAARRLRVDSSTARRWLMAGRLRGVKPGRKYLIDPASVDALIEGSVVLPSPSPEAEPEPSPKPSPSPSPEIEGKGDTRRRGKV